MSRSKPSLYVNYIYPDDLIPLSKAPNPEHPFKDPDFKVEFFKSINAYSKYWRSKGYVVALDGSLTKEKAPQTSWAVEVSDPEFHPVNWDLICSAFEEFGGCFGEV